MFNGHELAEAGRILGGPAKIVQIPVQLAEAPINAVPARRVEASRAPGDPVPHRLRLAMAALIARQMAKRRPRSVP